ncbi:CHASE2 domain-containing protein [Iningainema tapete]|uniref:CHASE2 domain-containing protein n=1 Tax=Iningainema tapete BLCC-T55 TaxID=2748662 RepID=A0A8J7C843_9CYAN|nr:CHASE2 domain-containing protein [Iningainema tapete]MBD2774106.1 CHASE2 domain-containing protein [Iningainema tapete BLCC-T55]
MTNYTYQVGGSLSINAPSYVVRQADAQLYEALKQGNFCYVLNSRQVGKSSLLVRTRHRLQQEGFICTTVDMTNIGCEDITPQQWYKGLVVELWSGFKLSGKINFKAWWQQQDDIPPVQKLSRFISEVLLVEFPVEKLFIFIDEADSIKSLDFAVDDFFALIRFCYNQRAIDPEYHRLTFVIFGVTTPSDLIRDSYRTPFNIGRAIELRGFTLDEVQPLVRGLETRLMPSVQCNAQVVIQEILAWTGGQPFLTQKLCQLVVETAIASVQDTEGRKLTIPPGFEAYWVESIVKERIIENWESQDVPEHLRTIRDRLLASEQMAGRLLGIYQQILHPPPSLGRVGVKSDDSREHIELLLSGLVVNHQGYLKVKNPIYQAVFHAGWVNQQMDNLRPYAQSFKAWIASDLKDESYLLDSTKLQQALAWSKNKRLSDLDYRFINASVELAKREVESDLAREKQARQIEQDRAEFTILATKKAHQILANAKKTSKRNTEKLRIGKGCIGSIAAAVAILVILVRFTGLLQGTEWAMLDRFFQIRPLAEVDPRITIITIDERDIRQIGQYPLPDRVLVRAIEKIKSYNPIVIGLDLYRDLPVEPGYQELVNLFKTTPNLIGVEKLVGRKIAPPPVLAQMGHVGLADQVLDGDGKLRRALLSIELPNGELRLNMGLQLALRYLASTGITPKPLPNHNDQIKLGSSVLVPFQASDGGYVDADTGGYQVLLNFHGNLAQYQTFSLADLLQNRVPANRVRERIILIGSSAESLNDFFQTPLSNSVFGPPQKMPGVIVHANIASMILNAAVQGKPMLRVWSEPVEWIWILLWSGVGAALSWLWKSPSSIIIIIMLAGLGLTLIAYLAFLQAWWIPVIPPFIGLATAAVTLPIVTIKQLEKIQLRQTVELLIAVTKEQPAVGQIAIEYLKQAESEENQALIDRIIYTNL